jgi:signal transduction histidine kinase
MRRRIFLGLLPLLILLVVVGGYGIALFSHLGGAVDVILRENYRSIVAAQNMKESAERMDSALLFMLAGEEERGRKMYDENLPVFERSLKAELNNITIPGEGELARKIERLHQQYNERAKTFFATPDLDQRRSIYFNEMLPAFTEIKNSAQKILELNQDNMIHADRHAREVSARSTRYMIIAIAVGLVIALFFASRLQRSILSPIKSLTRSAQELGEGNLDQVVPVVSSDEMGQLADTFNKMAAKLRAYRQVTSDEILHARQMTEVTFSAFPDPIIALDENGAITFKNPAADRLMTGLKLNGQLPEQVREQTQSVLRGGADYMPTSFASAICVRPSDKETFFLPRVIGIRSETGGLFGAAVILQDVTKLRLMDDVKTNLVSTVSHELKTPLTSVRMALHLLLEEQIGSLNSKQTELLLAARDESERLLTMINDLLDLARLESGATRMMTERKSARELIAAAIEQNKDVAERHGVTLVNRVGSDDLPAVAVESQQIGHVFGNLINNAARHSPRGEEVVLGATREDGGVRFAVVDKGPGIEPQYQSRVFDKFFRVAGQEPTGAGLGLSIAREIVHAHNGSIGVNSHPGQGAEFYFVLPGAGAGKIS